MIRHHSLVCRCGIADFIVFITPDVCFTEHNCERGVIFSDEFDQENLNTHVHTVKKDFFGNQI